MKTALRLLTLARNYFRKPTRTPMPVVCFLAALCVFAWIENSMLTSQNPCPVSNPSADAIFHFQSSADGQGSGVNAEGRQGGMNPDRSSAEVYMQIDFSDALPFPCPATRRCI